VTTSAVRRHGNSVGLTLQTRFPLLGGWETDFYIGYTVPTKNVHRALDQKEVIYSYDSASARCKLRIPLAGALRGVWAESQVTRVVLPEGAAGVQVLLPRVAGADAGTVQGESGARKTFLSNFLGAGRTVLVFRSSNVVDQHSGGAGSDIIVSYSLDSAYRISGPVCGALLALAALVCVSLLA
jgi:oligosaccharyltransferase complex subunit alpha (ribophorin I)